MESSQNLFEKLWGKWISFKMLKDKIKYTLCGGLNNLSTIDSSAWMFGT